VLVDASSTLADEPAAWREARDTSQFLSDVKTRHDKMVESRTSLHRRICTSFGAVSRKPMALPAALVDELYGLKEVEIRIMEAS